ncbi:MAG: hypothetical protein J0H39_19415 [Alphaproteobacteria bacterium]|jgi:outer membrane scaffolding protein for murein synthesis (MipA/OmpV family)|nr:hypothetical protein [Alphaproteobacteria bacterium]
MSHVANLPVDAERSDVKNVDINLTFQRALGRGFSLNMLAYFSRFMVYVADSPLVSERGARDQFIGTVGRLFRF